MSIERIAWLGPRPLVFDEAVPTGTTSRRLVGRDRELSELLDVCQTYAVVEITAASGVGKTSFVAGARPFLENAGARVLKAKSWSEALSEYDGLDATTSNGSRALALYCLALGEPPCADGAELSAMLKRLADGKPLVCMLDQLEELLRYRRTLATELLELAGRTAAANGVVHVVIARSEYRNDLRPVEVARAPTWHMLLSELADPQVIAEIVLEPVPHDVVVEDDLVARVVEAWTTARAEVGRTTAFGDPSELQSADFGLLHLQALLWRFKQWAVATKAHDCGRLTLRDFEAYARDRGVEDVATGGMALMADALFGYIEDIVARHPSPEWPSGPRLMVARAARHLSSNGFKVAQPRSSLVLRALQEELGAGRLSPELTRCFSGSSLGGGRRAKAQAFAREAPIEGAGLAHDAPPVEVAELMIQCLEDVLEALADERSANVLRKFQHGEDPIYELVHDGVAPVLDRWSESVLTGPMATIGGITARRGDVFSHDLSVETFVGADGEISPYWGTVDRARVRDQDVAVVNGQRWYGLGIHQPDPFDEERLGVRFASVVFRRCTFLGTIFIGVTLEDVVFEECELRGVALNGCRLRRVAFRECDLTGASFRRTQLEGVTIDGGGRGALLDGVAIDEVPSGAEVEVRGLDLTTGLAITRVAGGRWSFENVELRHLVFESDAVETVALSFADSTVRHATIDGSPESMAVTTSGSVSVWPLTDDSALVPEAAAGPQSPTPS